MITTHLEKLILCGRAFPKTFVAGGSQKCNLLIQNDRFIVITDIVYFSRVPGPTYPTTYANIMAITPGVLNSTTTQLTILGERGFNRFLFRDNMVLIDASGSVAPNGSHKIDTYLIHTKAVSFTFSKGGDLIAQSVNSAGVADNVNIASLQTPSDYGKIGTPGVLPVTTSASVSSATAFENNYSRGRNTTGVNEATELAFPVDGLTNLTTSNHDRSDNMPIAQIFYVEILGMPNNINI
jgi:hypothetical protein